MDLTSVQSIGRITNRSYRPLSDELFEIGIGMVLGDACMYKGGREPFIKFEQGYKQKEFLYHLFEKFQTYSFMEQPGLRLHVRGPMVGKEKSFWFKTFSHKSFRKLFTLFYQERIGEKKWSRKINENLVLDFLTGRGLAY
jgi:hypothetical protein